MDLEMRCRDLLDEVEDFEEDVKATLSRLQGYKRRLKEIMATRGYAVDSWGLFKEIEGFLAKESGD